MYRGPSTCEDRGQAVADDIRRATSCVSDVEPRQNIRSRNSICNAAAIVSGEGGTLQKAK